MTLQKCYLNVWNTFVHIMDIVKQLREEEKEEEEEEEEEVEEEEEKRSRIKCQGNVHLNYYLCTEVLTIVIFIGSKVEYASVHNSGRQDERVNHAELLSSR